MNNNQNLNPLMDKFNLMIEQSKDRMNCDKECQKEKKAKILKEEYLDSLKNQKYADDYIFNARKKYLTHTQGDAGYNDIINQEVKFKVEKFDDNMKKKIYEENESLSGLIKTYAISEDYYNNMKDYYETLKIENIYLKKQLGMDKNDILTNNRKTWYQNQGIDNQVYIYYVLAVLYFIAIVLFLFFIFMYPSHLSKVQLFFVWIGFIILFFVSPFILSFLIEIVYKIYSFLPKNVHLTI